MKVVQVNVSANVGSTGYVAEGIAQALTTRGHEAVVAYGRADRPGVARHLKIGNQPSRLRHGVRSLLCDGHGLGSHRATELFLDELEREAPDLVVLHNLHGYYMNYPLLFDFLRFHGTPVAWVLHDCWPFTGHCAYFDRVDCDRWKSGCGSCPLTHAYPRALVDRSRRNFSAKAASYGDLPNALAITPSRWLEAHVNESFMGGWPTQVIPNGVDLEVFRPQTNGREERPIALGVASGWPWHKGLKDMIALRRMLPEHWRVVVVGVTQRQVDSLPKGVEGVRRTSSRQQLAGWYARARVFVNPTYIDNFPTTNLEALACGTPVVTYRTGGSPEALVADVGSVVEKADMVALADAVRHWGRSDVESTSQACRRHAEQAFGAEQRSSDHVDAYERMQKG